jgi:hypothetical protein
MPTVLNVNEAKTNFSNVLATIERHNRTKTDQLLSRIAIKGDPCENDVDDWEEA